MAPKHKCDVKHWLCNCPSFLAAELRNKTQPGQWHQPYCQHLLDATQAEKDRGFLLRDDVLELDGWVGMVPVLTKAGNLIAFLPAEVVALVTSESEHALSPHYELWELGLWDGGPAAMTTVGLIDARTATRRQLAGFLVPHALELADDGLCCTACGAHRASTCDVPPVPAAVQSKLSFVAWLLAHKYRCANCSTDDLVPII